ncbi:hypothetical protein AYI70_g569 [Smittium culicis]|uniref:Uncharacterized protein n=1 Tax=Smittium culicis TaxID=133412 RepID=A0A1R1YG86_9FUNG|nr:hypothetical protein AYI70_g569 [Smittium culicis]
MHNQNLLIAQKKSKDLDQEPRLAAPTHKSSDTDHAAKFSDSPLSGGETTTYRDGKSSGKKTPAPKVRGRGSTGNSHLNSVFSSHIGGVGGDDTREDRSNVRKSARDKKGESRSDTDSSDSSDRKARKKLKRREREKSKSKKKKRKRREKD